MNLKTVEVAGITYAEVLDGKPVFIDEDGKEVPVDVANTRSTISRLNAEAKAFRESKEAAEARLKSFEGIEDPEEARKAIELTKNIKDGELIAAGKVEEIKAAAKRAAEEQVAATNKSHAEELARVQREYDALRGEYHDEKIGGAFKGSTFVKEKTLLPPSHAQKIFGDHFKIEECNLVAYDRRGNKVFSRSRPGEIAEFEEAIELLVEGDPERDHILKGNTNGGGGVRGGRGPAGVDLSNLPPVDRMNAVRSGKA